MTGTGGCGDHSGLSAELRAFALSALGKVEPLVDRLRVEPTGRTPETCANCPVCALLAALRGDQPELAGRLATHAAGLLAVLRAALEEGTPASSGGPPDPEPAEPERRVQRIPIDRGQEAG